MAAGAVGESVVGLALDRLVEVGEGQVQPAGIDIGMAALGIDVGPLAAQADGLGQVVDRVVEAVFVQIDRGAVEAGAGGVLQAQRLVQVVQRRFDLPLRQIGPPAQVQGHRHIVAGKAAEGDGVGEQTDGVVDIALEQGFATVVAVGDAVGVRRPGDAEGDADERRRAPPA